MLRKAPDNFIKLPSSDSEPPIQMDLGNLEEA